MPHGYGHGRGRDGTRSKLKSLINTLNTSSSDAAAGTSSASASADVANLNSMFSKLMTDLGGASSTNAQSSSTTLRGLLQSVLLHVQQQGSWAASVGQVVQVGPEAARVCDRQPITVVERSRRLRTRHSPLLRPAAASAGGYRGVSPQLMK